jgi:hypothetical protein
MTQSWSQELQLTTGTPDFVYHDPAGSLSAVAPFELPAGHTEVRVTEVVKPPQLSQRTAFSHPYLALSSSPAVSRVRTKLPKHDDRHQHLEHKELGHPAAQR